jgi:cytochrome c-type biogenesis protein CcmH
VTRSLPRISRSDAALLLAVLAVALSVALSFASSRGTSLDDRARVIDSQLRCPTCQGLSIADSPATSATQMRALVREQLAAGASDGAVRDFFVARYGRWILLDPPLTGPDLALWVVPAAILAAGALLVVRRSGARAASAAKRGWAAPPSVPVSRLGKYAVGAAMALALVLPIAAAVGPRLTGAAVSGGQVPQAAPSIADLEAYLRSEPRDVGAIVALGDALVAADRGGEAADRYKAALDIDPNNVGALLGVGTLLLAADRPEAAGPVFDRILTVAPDQPDALLYRAVARRRMEGSPTDEVRRDIQRFLEVASPADPRRAMATQLLQRAVTPPGSPPASFSNPPLR